MAVDPCDTHGARRCSGTLRVVLDFPHGLVLETVVRDPQADHESPALEALIAVGFVAREHDGLRVTETGRVALAEGVPSRLERFGLRAMAVGAVLLGVSWLAERVL